MFDDARYAATERDQSRPDATDPDYEYSLSIYEAADRYAVAGHPRTHRTVQRYCAKGHLDCHKVSTLTGEVYRVAPYSIARHIAQINEVIAFSGDAASRDLSRPAASVVAAPNLNTQESLRERRLSELSPSVATEGTKIAVLSLEGERDSERPAATPQIDMLRQDATRDDMPSRAVERLEREVERLHEDRDFLRDQIKTKDTQIAALLERDHETNILVRGLQQMLSPLLGGPRREPREQGSDYSPERSNFS